MMNPHSSVQDGEVHAKFKIMIGIDTRRKLACDDQIEATRSDSYDAELVKLLGRWIYLLGSRRCSDLFRSVGDQRRCRADRVKHGSDTRRGHEWL